MSDKKTDPQIESLLNRIDACADRLKRVSERLDVGASPLSLALRVKLVDSALDGLEKLIGFVEQTFEVPR